MTTASTELPQVSSREGTHSADQAGSRAKLKKRTMAVALAVALAAALGYAVSTTGYEVTDDAQIDGDISGVGARVEGTVREVRVAAGQAVRVGDVLAELDPAELDVAVSRARAEVALASAQLAADSESVSMAEASTQSARTSASSDIASAQAAVASARKELVRLSAELASGRASERQARAEQQRAETLARGGAVSQAELDARSNAADGAAAKVEALRHALAAARGRVLQERAQLAAARGTELEVNANAPRQVEVQKASVAARTAALDAARAELAQAELQRSYATLHSPVAGVVSRKSLAVGDHLAPGQPVIAVAQVQGLWVTANFRETQIERMRPGQAVDIHVDALDLTLQGTVESMVGATGARLSLFPPENAAGNYVKIVQRIPVRIRIHPGQPGSERLRIGMSVVPKVRL